MFQGNTATKDTPVESINEMSTAKLNEVIQDLPAEQQKALSQLYLFLVQVCHMLHFVALQSLSKICSSC